MDYKDAKIYLELCRSRSITQTARTVKLTQSAVTQRLQNLEREFDMQLMVRERGQKYVELTSYGAKMLPIVQQWIDLYETASSLKDEEIKVPMQIACTDSIGSYLLPRFLFNYASSHREVALSIHTNHSWEIFKHLEEGVIDIGLTNRSSSLLHDQLEITPLFSEPFVLLTSVQNNNKYTAEPVNPSDLDVERELLFEITPSFMDWRKKWFEEKRPFLKMSFAQPMVLMLLDSPCWAILPLSIARFFSSHYPLEYHRLSDEPERRICSLVMHRGYSTYKSEQKESFVRALKDFLDALAQEQ